MQLGSRTVRAADRPQVDRLTVNAVVPSISSQDLTRSKRPDDLARPVAGLGRDRVSRIRK